MVNSYRVCVIAVLLVAEEWPHQPSGGREIIKICAFSALHLGRGRAHGNLSLPTCSTFTQRTWIHHLLSLVKSQVYLVSTSSYLQNEHHTSQRLLFLFLVALCIMSHHPSVAAITAVTVYWQLTMSTGAIWSGSFVVPRCASYRFLNVNVGKHLIHWIGL